jgi:hypothetical protein
MSSPPRLRLADALIVSETRHKTIAGLYRLLVDAPPPRMGQTHGASVPGRPRISARRCIVADLVTFTHQSDQWTLSVNVKDSLGAKDKGTRHLETVEYSHDHMQSQGNKTPYDTNETVPVAVR